MPLWDFYDESVAVLSGYRPKCIEMKQIDRARVVFVGFRGWQFHFLLSGLANKTLFVIKYLFGLVKTLPPILNIHESSINQITYHMKYPIYLCFREIVIQSSHFQRCSGRPVPPASTSSTTSRRLKQSWPGSTCQCALVPKSGLFSGIYVRWRSLGGRNNIYFFVCNLYIFGHIWSL